MAEKWKMVSGQVYKLADVFDDVDVASEKAREMKQNFRVFLSKESGGKWAVYYRSKTDDGEGFKLYEVF